MHSTDSESPLKKDDEIKETSSVSSPYTQEKGVNNQLGDDVIEINYRPPTSQPKKQHKLLFYLEKCFQMNR